MAPDRIDKPAHELVGRVVDGWTVTSKIERPRGSTGGHFSIGYQVKKADDSRAFLKALDYSSAMRRPDVAEVLNVMTAGYQFERKVLDECERRRMNRIVRVLGAGTIVDPSFLHAVNYLIFEPAEGDVRQALDAMTHFDTAWALSTCHHAAVAVQQLHLGGLAHQILSLQSPRREHTRGAAAAAVRDLGYRTHPPTDTKAHRLASSGSSFSCCGVRRRFCPGDHHCLWARGGHLSLPSRLCSLQRSANTPARCEANAGAGAAEPVQQKNAFTTGGLLSSRVFLPSSSGSISSFLVGGGDKPSRGRSRVKVERFDGYEVIDGASDEQAKQLLLVHRLTSRYQACDSASRMSLTRAAS